MEYVTRLWPPQVMLPEPEGRTRHLSPGELVALLEAAEPDPVMYAAIVVSIATTTRQGEMLNLRWGDVDLDNGRIVLRKTKSGRPRVVEALPAAVEALRAVRKLSIATPAMSVFINERGEPLQKSALEMRWTKLRKAAKLTDFRWHDLRHTGATEWRAGGTDPIDLRDLMGHSNLSMTLRYAHAAPAKHLPGADKLNQKLSRPPTKT